MTSTAHFTIGEALGGYLNSTTNFALVTNYGLPATAASNPAGTNAQTGTYGGFNAPATAAAASMIIVKPTTEWGAELGYQHWWADNLRSNINAGFNAHYGIPIAPGRRQPSIVDQQGDHHGARPIRSGTRYPRSISASNTHLGAAHRAQQRDRHPERADQQARVPLRSRDRARSRQPETRRLTPAGFRWPSDS